MSGHKTGLNRFKRSIFSDCNRMKLEIIIRGKAGKFTSLWKLTSLFNNQQIKEEIAGEIRKYFKPNEKRTHAR